jgi:hypothetical protein
MAILKDGLKIIAALLYYTDIIQEGETNEPKRTYRQVE